MMKVLPDNVFFDPTDDFLDWVRPYTKHRTIVDCGAGQGRLSRKLKERGMEVISLDLNTRENPEVQVCPYDARLFPFCSQQVVILARPCHGPWVQETIKNALERGAEVLYISKPKNVEIDLEPEWISKPVVTNCGEEDEIAILIKSKESSNMEHWYLVKRKFHAGDYFKPEWRTKETRNFGECWGSYAGGVCPISDEDIVLEEVDVEDMGELDWSKTYLNMPDEDETAGWLSRDGHMFHCDPNFHDHFADLILRKTVRELEDTGWCRVYGMRSEPTFTCHTRLSAEQRNYLSTNGSVVEDWN